MIEKPLVDITEGISTLYISEKKRKHSETVKDNKNNGISKDFINIKDTDIPNKFKDLKDKFKDLASLYDEIEDQFQDVHFMNLSDLKPNKIKGKNKKNLKYSSTENNYKDFNYYYNNLNDYYYTLYKKITNKKQKTDSETISKNKNYEKVASKIEDKKSLYNIDKEISINFGGKKPDGIIYMGNQDNKTDTNTNNNNENNVNNKTNNNQTVNNRPKYFKYKNKNSRYPYSSKANNFIPSGIEIPNSFDNSKNNTLNNNKPLDIKITTLNDGVNKTENLQSNMSPKMKPINRRLKALLSPLQHLSLNNVSRKSGIKSANSFYNNNSSLSRSSLYSSISDTLKDGHDLSRKRSRKNKDKDKDRNIIPYIALAHSSDPVENLSKSQFLEDLNDYVEKINEENNIVHSTYSKLNTIPFNSYQTQNEIMNMMNESKSKTNYLKLYSSRSIRTSSSDFIMDSSSESLKNKSEYILWNKNLNIDKYNNNYYQINNEYSDDEDESDPFEDISDLSVSSVERAEHLSINNINESTSRPHHHHHHHSGKSEKRHKRQRNNSNNSINSNISNTSTITTDTTATSASNITINEADFYQDDFTYTEVLNNPMKKHEIYQMETSHNQFMRTWLDFENQIYTNLNSFIKNDFIDLYDFLCKKSDTISSSRNLNEIPLP